MSYLSLYRKWRPQSFDDIVGQKSVIRTLKNAIKLDRIAHAYLFCGPRGTGKTSTAKILAKALNCESSPDVNPCTNCQLCTKIHNNNSVDVIEIDAASNRGIDEIRDLRDRVKLAPTEGDYKIYIIDEAHMLTKEAFNALLKTLEEPPAYVIFILATTEPQALLETILSRCQRFDFARLSINDIVERLNFICQKEEIQLSTEAALTIARNAEGGMRDAISVLDQLVSYGESKIDLNTVNEVLGLVEKEILFEIVEIILNQKVDKGLELINQVLNKGKDVQQFVDSLINYFRKLLIQSQCQNIEELIEVSAKEKEKLYSQSSKFSVQKLLILIDILIELKNKLKRSEQARIVLEMGIIKLINSDLFFLEEKMLERIKILEQEVEYFKEDKSNLNKNLTQKPKLKIDKKGQNGQQKNKEIEANIESTEIKELKQDKKEVEISISSLKKQWPQVLEHIRQDEIRTHAMLKEGQIVAIENNFLIIEFDKSKSFHKTNVEQKKQIIEDSIQEVLGLKKKIKTIFSGSNNYKNQDTRDIDEEQEKDSVQENRSEDYQDLAEDPLVKDVLEVFGGQIIKVGEN